MAEEKIPKKPDKQKTDWNAEGGLPYARIPAFKVAYDCYKECQFRLRNVPVDSKPIARAVKENLMHIMVCAARARLNSRVLESLREALDLAIEVQITLRVLVETNAITKKDFANIAKYSENLTRQMVGWANSEEQKAKVRKEPEEAKPAPAQPYCNNETTVNNTKKDNRNAQRQLSLFD